MEELSFQIYTVCEVASDEYQGSLELGPQRQPGLLFGIHQSPEKFLHDITSGPGAD